MPKVYLFSHRLRKIKVTKDNFSKLIDSGDIIPIKEFNNINSCDFKTT